MDQAKQAYEAARRAEWELRQAVVDGDTSIDAADLTEAEANLRFAALRLQAAQKLVGQEAEAERRRRVEVVEERHRRMAAQRMKVLRDSWELAIRNGTAARQIAAIRSGEGSLNFPAEYAQMLVDADLLLPHELGTATRVER